jgi:hypothetical protein
MIDRFSNLFQAVKDDFIRRYFKVDAIAANGLLSIGFPPAILNAQQ